MFFLCGLLVWLLASRSRDESRDESPFFSPTPTTEKKKSATPDAPRLLGHCARSVPLFVPSRSLPQKARRVGVLGSRSRFKTPLQFHFPRPRASAMLVPTWGLNCRCTPASAPFGSPSARGYLGRGGVGSCVGPSLRLGYFRFAPITRFSNERDWDSQPRLRRARLPKRCFSCALIALGKEYLAPLIECR